jgi:hypothetical protein
MYHAWEKDEIFKRIFLGNPKHGNFWETYAQIDE